MLSRPFLGAIRRKQVSHSSHSMPLHRDMSLGSVFIAVNAPQSAVALPPALSGHHAGKPQP
jgi:hypothetical protein